MSTCLCVYVDVRLCLYGFVSKFLFLYLCISVYCVYISVHVAISSIMTLAVCQYYVSVPFVSNCM